MDKQTDQFMMTDEFRDAERRTSNSDRRDFLKGVAGAAAGLLATQAGVGQTLPPLPTIALGKHKVTRLIVGSNPVYGYSHFNRTLDQIMVDYFTDERVVKFMLDCEKAGINTFQSNYRERSQRLIGLIREAGCTMHWICLANPWATDPSANSTEAITAAMIKCVSDSAPAHPIAIAHHGSGTDRLFREGRLDLIKNFINKAHDIGALAGISTHNPAVIEAVEEKGWATDFYMACFYCLTRTPEEFQKEIGTIPVGETYLGSDPPRMCATVRRTRKTCLGFKILAAGRQCDSSQQVRAAFEFAFKNIKPTDATIVGMFPRFSDQISENARIVRDLH